MIQRLALMGFAPDLDTMIPPSEGEGSAPWIECDGFYPTVRGFRRLPSLVSTYPVLTTGGCFGAYVARYLDGTTKLFAGSSTALYLGQNGVWTDVSGAGAPYNVDDLDRWRFAQFGNDTLAVNGTDSPLVIPDTGSTFEALAGIPPVAKYIAVVNNFVFLLNLSSTVPGNLLTPTMWWCSGIGDDTSWTPDIATQASNGYLNDTEGDIVGAKSLGRNLVVYKQRAVYLFEYEGPPVVWGNRILSREAGALSNEAVVDVGDAHVFMGYDNFYLLDGANPPQAMENPLRRFLFQEDLNRNFQSAVMGRYDKATNVVYWHYPSVAVEDATAPQMCDRWIAWHRQSNRWTMGDMDIEAVVQPELPGQLGLTYGAFGSVYSTWGEADAVAYNSYVFSGSTDVIQAVFQPEAGLYTITGEPADGAFITLGDFGTGQNYYFIRRLRPRFAIYPTIPGSSITDYKRVNLGEDSEVEQGEQVFLDPTPGWINMRENVPFHRFRMEFPGGDAEIMGLDIDFDEAGIR